MGKFDLMLLRKNAYVLEVVVSEFDLMFLRRILK